MSIDGWRFAEQLVGITDEALRQRRKALEGKLGAHTDAVWEGVKATKEEVSKRLRDILYPSHWAPNHDLDGFLDEADARLNRNKPPLGNPPPDIVRNAALEEAVSAIPLTLPTGEYAETVERIRALKSKPAPVQCLVPSCDRPHQHEGTHTGGAAPISKPPTGRGNHIAGCILDTDHVGHCVVRTGESGPPPEPVHDFGWALAQMRAGKKVRRASWPGNHFYGLRGGKILVTDRGGEAGLVASGDIILTTDWDVVE